MPEEDIFLGFLPKDSLHLKQEFLPCKQATLHMETAVMEKAGATHTSISLMAGDVRDEQGFNQPRFYKG